MTKAPAFQFYAAEYLADMNVQLLTIEQEGAYIRLLAFCWREGKVPNDDTRLAALCKGVSSSVLTPVKELFQLSDCGNFLIHKRLESERKKQKKWKEKSSEAGKKSAIARNAKKAQELDVNQPSTNLDPLVQPKGNSAFASSSSSSLSTKTTTSTLASTALAVPAARGKLVCTLPLNQGDHEVFEADVQEWQALYLAVDVRQELRSIKGWALSNPTRRKTKSGIARFVNSWLSRAQNEAKPGGGNGTYKGKTGHSIDAARAAIQEIENSYAASGDGHSEAGEAGRAGLLGVRGGSLEVRDSGPGSGDEGIVLEATR